MRRLTTRQVVSFSTEHPWIVISVFFILTALMLVPIRTLKIEPDVKSLLPESIKDSMTDNHPEQSVDYDTLAVMFEGKNLFTLEGLKTFEKTINEIGTKLSADKIIIPFSQTVLERDGKRLVIKTLSPGGKAPVSGRDLELFRTRLEKSPFVEGLITSEKRDVLAAYLFVHKGEDYIKMMDEVRSVTNPLTDRYRITITGTMPFSAEIEKFLTKDFAKLLIFVLLTILLSYYLGFRSRRALFIPMILVGTGTVFSLGGMALAGFKLTMVSIISPPLVLTLGSSYSIHVLNSYYTRLNKHPEEDKKQAITASVTGISKTVVFASLTTIVALMSLLLASIQQTREFAMATSFGILITAVLSITLLPAFLSLQRKPVQKKLHVISKDILSKLLSSAGPVIIKARKTSVIIMVFIVAAFLYVYPRISFNTSPFKYFPQKSVVIRDNSRFMSKIGGIEEMGIVFTPKDIKKGFFLRKDILSNINDIEKKIKALGNVSFVFSFPSYLEYAGGILGRNPYDYSSKGLNMLVSRLFHTAAGSNGNKYINKDFTKLFIAIKIQNKSLSRPVDENDMIQLKKQLTEILRSSINPETNWRLNGISLAFLDLTHQMRRDFIVSTIGALIAIGILAFIAFRSIVQSLLALIPLLAGIFTSLILMALTRIPLDMTTIMVACISIGVGVDDSIHFLLRHHLNKEIYPGDPKRAVYETLIHAGRPIILTTVSIAAGLMFLVLAKFQPIRYFGLLIVFTLSTAMFATLMLLPPLLNTGHGKGTDSGTGQSKK